MTNLYTQIGGEPAVDAAVDIFYDKINSEKSLDPFFADIDMPQQRGKMKKFLTLLMTGKAENSGEYMRRSHQNLGQKGINDTHFDTVGNLLKETLEELSVPGDFIGQILGAVESLRDPVLNR
ncbi:group 1 truncated hemoglobin [Paremcibacter congregatus]|uniref:group I truncated hemoglobin n=1 Tax=Paremcibacter congregatus TaxID=2043170 RepID=UPI0030EF0872|tara:strand:+ start:1246 stop:1611 length:366 start_codon:yes stop_codon:yes gene_type:complete